MAWKYDPTTGAFYDDSDAPIKLSVTEKLPPPNYSKWLLLALGFLILIAAKKR